MHFYGMVEEEAFCLLTFDFRLLSLAAVNDKGDAMEEPRPILYGVSDYAEIRHGRLTLAFVTWMLNGRHLCQ